MPILFDEDVKDAMAAAVKKGTSALGSIFKDCPEDDFEFRPSFRIQRVEFGDGLLRHSIAAGEDISSQEVTVPNPAWGTLPDDVFQALCPGKKLTKTMKTRRFKTSIEFVISKLSGVVGLHIEKTDYQHIVGKKHVKRKRKHVDAFGFGGFFGEDDEQSDEKPEWNIPGLDNISSRVTLCTTALEIDNVAANEESNMLEITFKNPPRVYAQTSKIKDGEITYAEVSPGSGDAEVRPASSSDGPTAASLGRELLGLSASTSKMKIYFLGAWDDTDMFGEDGEGKTCLDELNTYLAELKTLDQANVKKRQARADLQKRRHEQAGRSSKDLPTDSFAKKAIEEFGLDVSDDTGYFDALSLEEEWKTWYEFRKEAETQTAHGSRDEEGEEEEEEDDFEEEDEAEYYESERFHDKFQRQLRSSFQKGLVRAGLSPHKAEAASMGLFLESVDIVTDGGPDPRTCTAEVRIFSAVGSPKMVRIQHEHHARARMSFCEEHAYIKAQIYEIDPTSGTFQVADDLCGNRGEFAIFDMDCHHRTGQYTNTLAAASDGQKLIAAIFGQKPAGQALLDNRSAFRVLMLAAGACAHPFTEMHYMDFSPLAYVDVKYAVKAKTKKDHKTKAENDQTKNMTKQDEE
eukprot:gb/GFBE01044439.1/.p1 GENE.gb/GFBE01044439.1/~~gb/GFBE01044439.1/.p1  ORF type:complete len:630 (+),score=161.94 gb/GFBE01044439.1/:1-1890(+)